MPPSAALTCDRGTASRVAKGLTWVRCMHWGILAVLVSGGVVGALSGFNVAHCDLGAKT